MAEDFAKKLVQEIKKAGKTVKDIITSIAVQVRRTARIVMEALRSLGHKVEEFFKEVVSWTITKLRDFIVAHKDKKFSLRYIFDEIRNHALTLAKKWRVE